MPLYFFSFRNGGEVDDDVGVELIDEQAARDAAVRGARSIIADCVQKGTSPLSARVQVEDDSGRLLFALMFKDAVEID